MPDQYDYSEDGKLHTRFSELKRCTLGQIDRVIAERADPSLRFKSLDMDRGTKIHREFLRETRVTHRTPKCFDECLDGALDITSAETEIANELWEGVVLHSQPDAYFWNEEKGYIIDYKTSITPDYVNKVDKRQVTIYALQLAAQNIFIDKAFFLVQTIAPTTAPFDIMDYRTLKNESRIIHITPEMLEEAEEWLENRIALLQTAISINNLHKLYVPIF